MRLSFSINNVLINQFPDDGRFWRVIWFSHLRDNLPVRGLKIQVLLAPLRESSHSLNNHSLSNSPMAKTIVPDVYATPYLEIASFPWVRIGSIWKSQELQLSPDYKTVQFELDFSQHPIEKKKLSESIPRIKNDSLVEDIILSKYIYPLPPHVLNCKCAAITISRTLQLIIPMSEIARFYYFNSDRLTHAVTEGWHLHQDKKLWCTERSSYISEDTFKLYLNNNAYRSDVNLLGRFAASQYSFEQMQQLYLNLMIKDKLGNSTFSCLPPFEGKTTLKVKGQYVNIGGTTRFLAYEILHCSALFPFQQLQIEGKSNFVREDEQEEQFPDSSDKPSFPPRIQEVEKPETVEIENKPSSLLDNIKKLKIRETKFSTSHINIIPLDTHPTLMGACTRDSVTRSATNIAYSTDDGSNSELDSRKIKQETVEENSTHELLNPGNFLQIMQAVTYLQSRYGLSYNIRTLENRKYARVGGNMIACTFYVAPKKQEHEWINITTDERKKRPRHALIVELEHNNQYWYLVDAERRSESERAYSIAFIHKPSFSSLFDSELKSILAYQVRNQSTMIKDNQMPEINYSRLNHVKLKSYSASKFSINILNKLPVNVQTQLNQFFDLNESLQKA